MDEGGRCWIIGVSTRLREGQQLISSTLLLVHRSCFPCYHTISSNSHPICPRLCKRLISARPHPIPHPPLPLPDRSPPNRIHPRPPRPRLRLSSLHSPIPLSDSIRSRRRNPKRIQFNSTSHLYYRPFNMGFTSE